MSLPDVPRPAIPQAELRPGDRMPPVVVLNDVMVEAQQLCRVLAARGVDSAGVGICWVNDAETFGQWCRAFATAPPRVLIADLNLGDGPDLATAALEAAQAVGLPVGCHRKKKALAGLALAAQAAAAGTGLVVLVSKYIAALLAFQNEIRDQYPNAEWRLLGDTEDEDEFARVVTDALAADPPVGVHRELRPLLDFLNSQFRSSGDRPFPHNLADDPATAARFREWATDQFPGLGCDGDAVRAAYEAVKGLAPNYKVRIGSLWLVVALFHARHGRSPAPVALTYEQGHALEVCPSLHVESHGVQKRYALLAFDHLVRALADDKPDNLLRAALTDAGLRLEFRLLDGENGFNRFRTSFRRQALTAAAQALGPLEAGYEPPPAEDHPSTTARAVLALQLLTGLGVCFRGDDGDDEGAACRGGHGLFFSRTGAGSALEVRGG